MRVPITTTIGAAALLIALGLAPAQAGPAGTEAAPRDVGGPSIGAGGPSGPSVMPSDPGAGPGAAPGPDAQSTMDDAAAPSRQKSAEEGKGDLGEPRAGDRPSRESAQDRTLGEEEGRSSTGTAEGEIDRDGKTGSAETELRSGDRDKKGASAKIDAGEKTKIKSYFAENKPQVKRVERSAVSVSIGVALPAGIALYALPADVIVVAGDCPLQYFVWGDDIVLVDSCSRLVVDIVPGIA